MYRLLRRALFALEPEHAHSVALSALQSAHRLRILPRFPDDPAAAVSLMGLSFPNRLGLAAGFDKNGRYIDALGALGFGFVEVGTVTPRPQPGQPQPRLFRFPSTHALINRMGFPNEGSSIIAARLAQRTFRGVCGVNIGKNAATPIAAAVDDYVACYRAVAPYADYVAVNVSSPNTADLRSLQQVEQLRPILESLIEQREALSAKRGRAIPLLVKISPDLSEDELRAVAQLLIHVGVDAVIATNTTVSRPTLTPVTARDEAAMPTDANSISSRTGGDSEAGGHCEAGGQCEGGGQSEAGGMSGEPLRPLALRAIRILRSALGARVPIIGVGGIASGADAVAALDAGADLVQIYTGLIYRGPMLIREIRAALKRESPVDH